MELRQLRYFVAVADEKHFGRAAARMHVAQPGLSQQISRLERTLGAQLLFRTTRRVALTEAGAALLPEARRILSDTARAESVVGQTVRGELGVLKIGFVSSAALSIVPRLAHSLHDRWPGLSLQLNEMTTSAQLHELENGRLDVGLGREVSVASGLIVRPLVRERLYVAVHDSHRLAAHRSVPLAQLAGERLVVFPRQRVSFLYDHVANLCRNAGLHLEVAEEAVQFTTILGLVAGNAGIAIVPEPLRALHLPGLRYLALEDEAATSLVSVLYRPDRADTSPVRKLLTVASATFPEEFG